MIHGNKGIVLSGREQIISSWKGIQMASLAISQPELDAVPGHQHSSLVDQIANSVRQLAEGNFYLKNEIRTKDGFEEIVGESPALKRVLQEVEIVTIRNLINCW